MLLRLCVDKWVRGEDRPVWWTPPNLFRFQASSTRVFSFLSIFFVGWIDLLSRYLNDQVSVFSKNIHKIVPEGLDFNSERNYTVFISNEFRSESFVECVAAFLTAEFSYRLAAFW